MLAGGVYTVEDAGGYRATKILLLDDAVVHIRVFANKYPDRPDAIDAEELDMGVLGSGSYGIGHVPITRKSWEDMNPVFLHQESVSDAELQGYNAWRAAGGGVFGV